MSSPARSLDRAERELTLAPAGAEHSYVAFLRRELTELRWRLESGTASHEVLRDKAADLAARAAEYRASVAPAAVPPRTTHASSPARTR